MDSMAEQLVEVAETAGRALKEMQNGNLVRRYKSPADLVTSADSKSHEIISSELRKRFPGCVLILEEEKNPPALPSDYLVADELDGTVIYSNGLSEWGISLAYIEGGCPKVGVLHQPRLGVTVVAWRGGGTWIGGRRVNLSSTQSLRDGIFLVELNRFLSDEELTWVTRISRCSIATRSLATAVGNAVELLCGHACLYINCRGAKVWDFAASVVAVERRPEE